MKSPGKFLSVLRSQLSGEDQQKLTKGSTDNPEAYQLYLKGKYYTNKLTKDGFGKGIDYFNQAIALDPNYGLAYSGLAYNYINQDDWFMPPNEAGPKTKDAAERALGDRRVRCRGSHFNGDRHPLV